MLCVNLTRRSRCNSSACSLPSLVSRLPAPHPPRLAGQISRRTRTSTADDDRELRSLVCGDVRFGIHVCLRFQPVGSAARVGGGVDLKKRCARTQAHLRFAPATVEGRFFFLLVFLVRFFCWWGQ